MRTSLRATVIVQGRIVRANIVYPETVARLLLKAGAEHCRVRYTQQGRAHDVSGSVFLSRYSLGSIFV